MRRFLLAAVLIPAAFWIGVSQRGFAQDQNQPAQSSSQDPSSQGQGSDASAQQKKPAAKPKNARDSSSQNSSSSKASDSPPDAPQAPPAAPAKDENPFPEAVSRDAARASSPDAPAKAPSASAENPFPEDVSRRAAKGDTDSSAKEPDGQERDGQAKDQPSGASSSRSSAEDGNTGDSLPQVNTGGKIDTVPDPVRAKKDTQVGAFYFQRGDYRGAYLRYKDALSYDPADVDAVFGLAEAARALKLVPEAERNYQLYLEIVPDGSKAREAAKALHSLDTQR